MIIIKYITLILIFICSVYIGILISKKYVNRVIELKEMKTALNIFETKVKLTYAPIPEIFDEISQKTSNPVSKIFNKAKEEMEKNNAEQAWDKAINTVESNMNKEDISVIKELGNLLGKVDIEGQVNRIKMIDSFLDMQIKKAEDEKGKSEKMYKTLGVTIGLAIVVVLI